MGSYRLHEMEREIAGTISLVMGLVNKHAAKAIANATNDTIHHWEVKDLKTGTTTWWIMERNILFQSQSELRIMTNKMPGDPQVILRTMNPSLSLSMGDTVVVHRALDTFVEKVRKAFPEIEKHLSLLEEVADEAS